MTAPAATRPAAPTSAQAQAIKDLLRSQRALAGGGDLLILYARAWSRQASWICAYGRAAGLTVRLAALLDRADSFTRRLRSERADGLTIIVLTGLRLDLPDGCLQLAGLQLADRQLPGLQLTDRPGTSPIELWRPSDEIAAAAQARARAAPSELSIATSGGQLDVTTGQAGWRPETGHGGGATAQVSPAGAIRADVATADGTFVADGAIALNRPVTWDARLATRPVRLSICGRVVTELDCADDTLARFLRRAVFVHHAATVTSVALGLRDDLGEFSPEQGPVNACQGVAVRLAVPSQGAYSPASADLQIDLAARRLR